MCHKKRERESNKCAHGNCYNSMTGLIKESGTVLAVDLTARCLISQFAQRSLLLPCVRPRLKIKYMHIEPLGRILRRFHE